MPGHVTDVPGGECEVADLSLPPQHQAPHRVAVEGGPEDGEEKALQEEEDRHQGAHGGQGLTVSW